LVNNLALAAVLACALFGDACVRYVAKPLQPGVLETQFRTRSFTDAGLRDFAIRECGNSGREWPPSAFDLNALVCAGLYFHPDIGIARAQLQAAEAGVLAARPRPNPGISAEGGYNRTPDSVATYAVSPVFTVETAGKRGDRILEAEKLTDAARISLTEIAWRVRNDIRTAFVAHYFAQRHLALLLAQESIETEAAEIYQKRLDTGEAARPELITARNQQASTAVSIQISEGNVVQARAALAAAVGVPETALESVRLNEAALDEPPSPESLQLTKVERAGLLHRADIRRCLDEYAAAEAHVRLEIANQYPDVPLTPAYSFQEGFPAYTLASAIDSIPVFNRHQGPIALAEAKRSELKARFVALQSQVIAQSTSALDQYRAAMKQWAEARDHFQSTGRERERAVRAAFTAGDANRLELAAARAASVAADQTVTDALERVQSMLGVLEDAVQAPLAASEDPLPEMPN
jgi:cobalt-zinc-cadmium efflux system outer membrane protein